MIFAEFFPIHPWEMTDRAAILFTLEINRHDSCLELRVCRAFEINLCWESCAETGIARERQARKAFEDGAFAAGLVT